MKAKLTVTIDEELIPKAKNRRVPRGSRCPTLSSAPFGVDPRKAPFILGALARTVQGRSPEDDRYKALAGNTCERLDRHRCSHRPGVGAETARRACRTPG